MNKRNLQKELEEIIEQNSASGYRPKLLLHVCCAPCSSYCLEYLSKYFEITEYYSNSNIDDTDEYYKRRDEAKRLCEEIDASGPIAFTEGEYQPEHYHELVFGHETDCEGGERCAICFNMRLEDSAKKCREGGFDYFTTSLSISPLKNAQLLCEIGESAAEKYGVRYLPSDFKKKNGYKRSIELSEKYNLYRQDYCGCSYSKNDRSKSNE